MKTTIWTLLLITILSLTGLLVSGANFLSQNLPVSPFTNDKVDVNFNVSFNQTTDGNTTFEILIYNRSRNGVNYSILVNSTITNATLFGNISTLKNDNRYWWFVNITNVSGGAVVSNTKVFDIDTAIYTSSFGADKVINFTEVSGAITSKGNITAGTTFRADVNNNRVSIGTVKSAHTLTVAGNANISSNLTLGLNNSFVGLTSKHISLFNSTTDDFNPCTYEPNVYGQIRLNQSSGQFRGCNGTDWARLNI